jgi:hypothetical protein
VLSRFSLRGEILRPKTNLKGCAKAICHAQDRWSGVSQELRIVTVLLGKSLECGSLGSRTEIGIAPLVVTFRFAVHVPRI